MLPTMSPATIPHHAPFWPRLKIMASIYANMTMKSNCLNIVNISEVVPFPIPWNMEFDMSPGGMKI